MLQSTLQNEVFASAIQFAELVGINRQNAAKALQKCCTGKLWRGALLQVYFDNGKGGKSGLTYRVQLSSIPTEHITNKPLLEQIKQWFPRGRIPCYRSAQATKPGQMSGKITWPCDDTNPNFPAYMIHRSIQDQDLRSQI